MDMLEKKTKEETWKNFWCGDMVRYILEQAAEEIRASKRWISLELDK